MIAAGGHAPFGFRRITVIEKNKRNTDRKRCDFEKVPEDVELVLESYRLLLEEHLSVRKIAKIMGRKDPRLRYSTSLSRTLA